MDEADADHTPRVFVNPSTVLGSLSEEELRLEREEAAVRDAMERGELPVANLPSADLVSALVKTLCTEE